MNTDRLEELNQDIMLLVLLALIVFVYLRGVFKNPPPLPWRRRPAPDLAQWLEIATGKLAPSAQGRVRAEIAAHYAEAVTVHREAGVAETTAQITALADLGDAYVAARRFNREYLTEKEARLIASSLNPQRKNWQSAPPKLGAWFLVMILCVTLLLDITAWFRPDIVGIAMVLPWGLLLLQYVLGNKLHQTARGLAGESAASARLGRYILLISVHRLITAAVFTSLYFSLSDGRLARHANLFSFFLQMLVGGLGPMIVFSANALQYLRIHRKLQSAEGEKLDLPPQNSAAAA